MKQSQFILNKTIGFQKVLAIIIIFSLLAGCQIPWRATLEVLPEGKDQAQAEETESPTPEPRQDLPPAVVGITPLPDSVIELRQTFLLQFNQPMDTKSVEAAIHFQPGINGRFTWEGDTTLAFTPDQPLAAGSKLRLILDTSAQAANKLNLREPFEVGFATTDTLQILQVFPAKDAVDIDPQSTVFVVFNQPVVALGAESEGPPAFSLTPEAPGDGEWLNTHTYRFVPQPTMGGGTEYTIQINNWLEGVSGAALDPEQPRRFAFITTHPQVSSITPGEGERLGLEGPVRMAFNIPMDPESVEALFDLIAPDGARLDGTFEWDEDQKSFSFIPSARLNRGRRYTIRLRSGAKSSGGLPIDEPIETNLTTYPAFSLDPGTPPVFNAYYGQFGSYQILLSSPIDLKHYRDAVRISPDVSAQSIYLSEDNRRINLSGYFLPETQYTLSLEESLMDAWGAALAEQLTFTFSTPPAEPAMSLVTGYSSNNLVFVPAFSSEVVLQATNINTVTIEISPISIGDLVTLLHPDNYDYRQAFLPASLETRVLNLNLTRNISEIVRLPLSYEGNALESGVYYLGVSSPDISDEYGQQYQKFFLIVSENNLVMKVAPEEVLVWATKLADRKPVSSVPVTVYNSEGEILAEGQTKSDGLFDAPIERSGAAYTTVFTVAGQPGSRDFGFSISTWSESYAYYEAGIRLNTSPKLHEAYLYTDRPLYQPGDTVYFKAVVFKRENGVPAVPGFDTVDVTLTSDAGMAGIPGDLYSETLTLDRFNTVSGSIQLPEDAPTGYYHFEVRNSDILLESLYFSVKTYRKPEVEIELDFDSLDVLEGEGLKAMLQAQYYFGLPAANQTFSWTLFRDEAYFHLPGYQVGIYGTDWLVPQLTFFSPLGRVVDAGGGVTDQDGYSDLAFQTGDLTYQDAPEGTCYDLHLETTLQDESGLPVSFRASTRVHPESFYIGVRPETYFGRVGDAFTFSILTVDWEKEPVGDVPIGAIFSTIRWEVEETMNPERPYRYTPETTLVGSASPQTDAEGKASVAFTPEEPGTYRLRLESGRAVTEVILWVAGESAAIWPRQLQNRIHLVADADSYQPGQVAEVFIPNPFAESGRALVTIERGVVMRSEILEISGSGYTLSLPIDEDSVPNIYLSVVLLGEDGAGRPDYRQGVINLPVTPLIKTLEVTLTLDPAETQPGGNVSAALVVSDALGNPVQGEFSVAVVDKALLALVDPISQPILQALYGEQPLSIQTSYSLKTYAQQLALSNLDLGRGGGGGDAASQTIRADFPDTAFWQAHVVTAADGTARLSLPMPDSLTTWVVSVRGLTEDYLVGETEAEIVTSKDLMIRPVTPRFVVAGDRVEMSAVVHNNSETTLLVDVSLDALGFSFEDEGQRTQQVSLSAGGQARVAWWGRVESVEEMELIFRAASGELEDASKPVWGALPVLHYTAPLTFSTAGQLSEEGERLELVSLPVGAEKDAGTLSVALMPSLTAIVLDGIRALDAEGYQDTVSILSRLLANLNAYIALSKLGVDSPALEQDLVEQVERDIRSLLDTQHYEGGWSWWKGASEPDPFITAYVLLGLERASQAGLEVDAYFIDLAVSFLQSRVLPPKELATGRELDRLAFQVYALRSQGLNLTVHINGLYARRSELSPWSLGLLALTVNDLQPRDERVGILLADLETRALRSATGVNWEGDQGSWLLPGTPLFNTAVAAFTLAQLDPASTSLIPAVRYLIAHQEAGGGWSSPYDSAWTMMAIVEALQGTGDAQADFDFQAAINDLEIAQGSAGSAQPASSVSVAVPANTLYGDSPNALLIQRSSGTGTLYYRADLQAFQPAGDAAPINRGISLQRSFYLAGEGCPDAEGCEPIQSFRLDAGHPGQTILVALTVHVPQAMYHFMLEDHIPAGTEIHDPGLKTSVSDDEEMLPLYDVRAPFSSGWGWWWFAHPQIYNDHLLWTADYLPAGTYTLVYQLVPLQRGAYQVLPAHAWQYFFPEVMGTSGGEVFVIE